MKRDTPVEGKRWLAGYFTDADGNWFFRSKDASCGWKAYTLTTDALRPRELPDDKNQQLRETIDEAIYIVDSIEYKRCAPKGFSFPRFLTFHFPLPYKKL
jgi:hypothetical protein